MRVLFVVPYAPNLVRVRPLQLIAHLARQGHDLTVATLWTGAEEQADLRHLSSLGLHVVSQRLTRLRSAGNCLAAMPSSTPLQAVYCWHPGLATDLAAQHSSGQVAPYDVIHVEHLRGARYGLWLKRALAGGCRRRDRRSCGTPWTASPISSARQRSTAAASRGA